MTIKRIVRNRRLTASHIDWATVPDFDDTAAGAFSEDIGQYATDLQGHALQFSIAATSPSDEADITAAGLSLDPDTGVLSGTYDGTSELAIIVHAEDVDELTPDQDWQNQIDAAGVVWYQKLATAAEVNAFRWTAGFSGGNDPNANGDDADLLRLITDEDGDPCMEAFYPAGRSPNSCHWIRTFSPLNTGSGKAVNDPADGGALTVRGWAPTNGSSTTSNWTHGWYAHASQSVGAGTREGSEYYLQLRVKMDPVRKTLKTALDSNGDPTSGDVGKLVWSSTTHVSFALGEHVGWSYGDDGNDGDKNYLRMYVASNGTDPLDQVEPGPRIQPGSDSATDWSFSGGWDTVMWHVTPGIAGTVSGTNATHLQVYAAHEGETSYTKIWDQTYEVDAWEPDTGFGTGGLNALYLTAYNNSRTFTSAFYHRYRKVIFSKQFIACPQA